MQSTPVPAQPIAASSSCGSYPPVDREGSPTQFQMTDLPEEVAPFTYDMDAEYNGYLLQPRLIINPTCVQRRV